MMIVKGRNVMENIENERYEIYLLFVCGSCQNFHEYVQYFKTWKRTESKFQILNFNKTSDCFEMVLRITS